MNLEKAIRNKFRFPSVAGLLTLEDLFDLPLKSTRGNRADLDGVAKEISRQLRAEQEDSFVETSTNTKKTELTEKLEIVVGVIAIIRSENEAAASAAAKRALKGKLVDVLARKQDAELEGKSTDELKAMIDSL